MLRGRHRGLPVAIDRAVMLPDIQSEDQRSVRRRSSQADDRSGYGIGGNPSVQRISTIAASTNEENGAPSRDGVDSGSRLAAAVDEGKMTYPPV